MVEQLHEFAARQLTGDQRRAPRVNGDRLWTSLERMAQIGATPKGGVCRLALTELDRESRDLFAQWARDAGCTVRVDQMGNVFARRAGRDPHAAPVMTGSHADSQPTGGRYDGIYGVLGGLEVVRALNDARVETERPIDVVIWTNEEGSRFAPAMIASGVFAGVYTLEYGLSRADGAGTTIGDALVGAARMIEFVDALGRRHAPHARATVGMIEARPNSRNTVPGGCFFTIECRHPDDAVLDAMDAALRGELERIAAQAGLAAQIEQIFRYPPVPFAPRCVDAVREAADALGLPHADIVSGAGHDACYLARIAPTGMIFVPCVDGLSHNEAEAITPEWAEAGAHAHRNTPSAVSASPSIISRRLHIRDTNAH